jgi:hypothetical protein
MTNEENPSAGLFRALDLDGLKHLPDILDTGDYGQWSEFSDSCYEEPTIYRTGKGDPAELGIGPGPGSKRQSTRRFQVLNTFREVGAKAAGLGPSERLVWMVLWSCVDARSGLARVSYRAMADKTGLGARQVFRVVHELIARGFLEVDTRGGPKKWTVNAYRAHPSPKHGKP